MRRHLFLLLALVATGPARAQTLEPVDAEKLRQKPITTVPGPAGDLLRQWWKEGTAAGNVGDYYDNRDGDHSPLDRALFPQLLAVKYSPEDLKLKKNWAAARVLLPAVVFGNSSTSAPPTQGGSNPRAYYTNSRGLPFLADQYAHNNLYIYPEHRDHDPGHNGPDEGFGDLYPTNTPYLLISQGSSGSDQPFMRAVPLTLAAFRPEVKKKLTEAGALMPAVQMILRRTNKHLKGPDDYLTGKAHPTVFEGSWVDDLAMVKLAHAMEPKALPPLVRLKVVEEDPAKVGLDYFEAGIGEALGDTPSATARVHRSKDRTRRLVVSTAASSDLGGAPLTFTWVVLRGDPDRIRIKPSKDGSVAEVTVAYHERRPVAPGSPLESNRVDIGVFAHNGTYYSAPGFITFFTLDSEARTYDDMGRIAEIGYGMGETRLTVTEWQRLLTALAKDPAAGKLLDVEDTRRGAVAKLLERCRDLEARVREAQEEVKAATANEKDTKDKEQARKQREAARKKFTDARKDLEDLFEKKAPEFGASVRVWFEEICRKLARSPDFLKDRPELLAALKGDPPPPLRRSAELLRKVQKLGVFRQPAAPTAYDRAQLEHLHLAALVDRYFPGAVQVTYVVNFVDQRLTAPRSWRDVYHYDAAGQCTGWTRYHGDRDAEEFNHEGLVVVAKDDLGRCKKARTVRYVQAPGKTFPSPNPLRTEPGDEYVTYTFTGPDDRRGTRSAAEPVK
jgi:hypothetical protein